MNQNERKTVMRRMVLLIAVAALVMGLYALRLIFLQQWRRVQVPGHQHDGL